jgi:chromosome segregation ATPase
MKNLEDRFAEIERRVKALVAENRSSKKRIRELEKELSLKRHEAQKSVQFHDQQIHLKSRVEKILKDLEAVEVNKAGPDQN